MKVSSREFGALGDQVIHLYTLENDGGMVVKIMTYGATITSLTVPDENSRPVDLVCGFDTLEGYFSEAYQNNSPYFGCAVGRYAARIKDGRFSIGGSDYQLAKNDGPNHLHGGKVGFDKRVWKAEAVEESDTVGVRMFLTSEDGDEGYPGRVELTLTYLLNNKGELSIHYLATSDKPTPLSLTNHSYFNLGGFEATVRNHHLSINASQFLQPDETNVPVGKVTDVNSSVWDYRVEKPIEAVFAEEPKGFEHYYVFDKPLGELKTVVSIKDPNSGRRLEISTTEPGALFYTGYYTADNLARESGVQYGQFKGFCCETSRYPNGPNLEGSPGSILEPGEVFESTTVFAFDYVTFDYVT